MIRITADNKIPFLKGVLEPFAQITYLPGSQIDRDAIMDSDALLVRTRTKCSSDLLSGTRVRFIGTATIGFDHIDRDFCNANNIRWTNAPGCNSSSVMQYIAAALMKISSESGLSPGRLTLGIIGVGNVGSKVHKLAQTLGMRVLLNDPPRQRKEKNDEFVSIEQVLQESDVITLHVGGRDPVADHRGDGRPALGAVSDDDGVVAHGVPPSLDLEGLARRRRSASRRWYRPARSGRRPAAA